MKIRSEKHSKAAGKIQRNHKSSMEGNEDVGDRIWTWHA
jgi:hypothetical protein